MIPEVRVIPVARGSPLHSVLGIGCRTPISRFGSLQRFLDSCCGARHEVCCSKCGSLGGRPELAGIVEELEPSLILITLRPCVVL